MFLIITDLGEYSMPASVSCNGTGKRSILYRPMTTQRNKCRLHSPTANQRHHLSSS